jgi:hypothetical protein
VRVRAGPVKEGSGNVFADLGFPHPERERLKARLRLQIYRLIKDRGLTQATGGLTDRGIIIVDGVLQPVPAGGRSFESFPVKR